MQIGYATDLENRRSLKTSESSNPSVSAMEKNLKKVSMPIDIENAICYIDVVLRTDRLKDLRGFPAVNKTERFLETLLTLGGRNAKVSVFSDTKGSLR